MQQVLTTSIGIYSIGIYFCVKNYNYNKPLKCYVLLFIHACKYNSHIALRYIVLTLVRRKHFKRLLKYVFFSFF